MKDELDFIAKNYNNIQKGLTIKDYLKTLKKKEILNNNEESN